jgi:hypothetical protein
MVDVVDKITEWAKDKIDDIKEQPKEKVDEFLGPLEKEADEASRQHGIETGRLSHS